jgi:hypothetical protein
MAPDQTRGNSDEIDTRKDVYALGVILYELLTGHYPYPVAGRLAEVLQHIASTPPERPRRKWNTSTGVLRRVAGPIARSSRPQKCPIDDDLETIILKALSKERERRYQSAGELGGDLRRYLAGDALLAKRDSAWYMLRKLARRHRLAAAVVGLLGVIVVAVACICVFLYYEAEAARGREAVSAAAAIAQANHNASLVRHNVDREKVIARQLMFGWFLFELHSGRRARAEQIRALIPANTGIHAAMNFLLDESLRPEQLIAAVPPEQVALAFYAIAEQHLRHGREDEAVRSLEDCIRAKVDDDFIKAAARAWLMELRPERAAALSEEAKAARGGRR